MRNISFALTTDQVLARTKTVTRRIGWADLQPGTLLQPVRKSMGLKRGEKVEKLGVPIRVVSVRREPVARMLREHAYGVSECRLEGFGPDHPKGTPLEFVRFFCDSHGCQPEDDVTRIEFAYTCLGAELLTISPSTREALDQAMGLYIQAHPNASPQEVLERFGIPFDRALFRDVQKRNHRLVERLRDSPNPNDRAWTEEPS